MDAVDRHDLPAREYRQVGRLTRRRRQIMQLRRRAFSYRNLAQHRLRERQYLQIQPVAAPATSLSKVAGFGESSKQDVSGRPRQLQRVCHITHGALAGARDIFEHT